MEDQEQRIIDLERSILDPETALYCLTTDCTDTVIVPLPGAPIFNNLDEYFKKSCPQKPHTNPGEQSNNKSLSKQRNGPPKERNFDKILLKPSVAPQIPGQSTSSGALGDTPMKDGQNVNPNRRTKPDVLSKADKLHEGSGPIYQLKKLLNARVRVLIRRRRNVPYVSRVIQLDGKLIMFDAHFNIFLHHVEESFKYTALGGQLATRSRLRSKLFVRGDNIILISENAKTQDGPDEKNESSM